MKYEQILELLIGQKLEQEVCYWVAFHFFVYIRMIYEILYGLFVLERSN